MCRAASVVLGQPRALVPDDIPRLSALPLHERSGISPSAVPKGKVDLIERLICVTGNSCDCISFMFLVLTEEKYLRIDFLLFC